MPDLQNNKVGVYDQKINTAIILFTITTLLVLTWGSSTYWWNKGNLVPYFIPEPKDEKTQT